MYVIVSMGWYGQCSYGMSELWNIDYIDDSLSDYCDCAALSTLGSELYTDEHKWI